MWLKHPQSVVIDSATYLLTISSADMQSIIDSAMYAMLKISLTTSHIAAMGLYDICMPYMSLGGESQLLH